MIIIIYFFLPGRPLTTVSVYPSKVPRGGRRGSGGEPTDGSGAERVWSGSGLEGSRRTGLERVGSGGEPTDGSGAERVGSCCRRVSTSKRCGVCAGSPPFTPRAAAAAARLLVTAEQWTGTRSSAGCLIYWLVTSHTHARPAPSMLGNVVQPHLSLLSAACSLQPREERAVSVMSS